jgi:hypothetical protein
MGRKVLTKPYLKYLEKEINKLWSKREENEESQG